MKNKLVIYIKCCIALTLCLLPVNVAAKTYGAEQQVSKVKKQAKQKTLQLTLLMIKFFFQS